MTIGAGDPAAGAARAGGQAGAEAVIDLSGEPVLDGDGALAARVGRSSTSGSSTAPPGFSLTPPPRERLAFDGPVIEVIGTGKRTGQDGGRRPLRVAAARARASSP